MPGSARRLKKKLQEATSPSPPGSPPNHSNPITEGISNLLHPNSHHKSHSTGQGVISNEPVHPVNSAQSAQSVDSVASNPNNYMTDQQLEQDLALEEMAERQDNIGHQPPPPPPGQGMQNLPPPPGPGANLGHSHSAPPQLPPNGSQAPLPPPPAPVDQGKSGGGMYGNSLFGNGGNSGGGKKKSSKQKFAERQVSASSLFSSIWFLSICTPRGTELTWCM